MDTKTLEKFAQNARRHLHEQVAAKLDRVLSTDSAELRAKEKTVQELRKQIKESSREAVVERVAYTWFNRFIALRYMDVNHYTRMGTVSPAPGFTQPEIFQEAKQGHVDHRFDRYVDEEQVFGLLNGRLPSSDPQQEAYRLLLVGVCNYYHTIMPFMFEEIDDYTELLMPDDLLSEGSIVHATREALTPENCEDVEVIGWLYQFYISEKKDKVIKSKKKIQTKDIPAATQLFTPHWIVRYVVENSLGRLWMLNHPDSRLAEQMDYYIEPEQEETDYLRVESPEELTVCDPAVGSGHMLTYAFDLLYAIYEEQGYNAVDIPRLILEKNLYGVEIDERAGALAAFALMMKARDNDRRFFRRELDVGGIQPNVIVLRPISFEEGELDEEPWLQDVEEDQRERLLHDLHLFEEADNVGSLLRPELTASELAVIVDRVKAEGGRPDTLFEHERRERVQRALTQAQYLARSYHAVAANPPYMGSGNMNARLKGFLKGNYEDYKSDLFAAFIVRIMEMTRRGSFLGMMTPFNWMFLGSFEKLRQRILRHSTITSLVRPEFHAFFDSAYVTVCGFTLFTQPLPEHRGAFIDLNDFYGADIQSQKALEAINNPDCAWFYRASAIDFEKVDGSPILFTISDRLRDVFATSADVSSLGGFKRGIATGDNDRFLRFWFEVDLGHISFNGPTSNKKWFPYNKGGEKRRWYGNRAYIINWQNNGYEIKNFVDERGRLRSRPQNIQYNFWPNASYSSLTSGVPSFRYYENHLNDQAGNFLPFRSRREAIKILGLLNSVPSVHIAHLLSPTMNILIEDLNKIPVETDALKFDLAERCVELAKTDWDAYELSWDFADLPLLRPKFRQETLPQSYIGLRQNWRELTQTLAELEEKNNRIFIEAYALEGELQPSVPVSEIGLSCNPHHRYGSSTLKTRNWANFRDEFPDTAQRMADIAEEMAPEMPEEDRLGLEQRLLNDTMREFISYAVGCMFGRYSLDKPGLILTNQGETVEDYLRKVSGQVEEQITFMPDRDNVIPMLDGDWFADDISERFKKFLRVTFGEEHYEENVAFIEAALNRTIQGYFLRNFYDHHVKMYQKRPIYWLFSSPNGSFNALVYMHRYRPDTVSVILNDYLREFRTKLQARKSHLQQVERSASAAQRDKTQAVKEIEGINKILNELKEYEDEVLYPLATQQVEIDLNDGVQVNYNKVGKALEHVRGLSQ